MAFVMGSNALLSGRPPTVGGRAVVAMLSQGGRGAARCRLAAAQTVVRRQLASKKLEPGQKIHDQLGIVVGTCVGIVHPERESLAAPYSLDEDAASVKHRAIPLFPIQRRKFIEPRKGRISFMPSPASRRRNAYETVFIVIFSSARHRTAFRNDES